MNKHVVARWNDLPDRTPTGVLVENVDLVIVRFGDEVSVFYGRCLHRGAMLADGHVDRRNLICGVHNWDYRVDTGISEYANDEKLPKFTSWIEDGNVLVDSDEIKVWEQQNPQPYDREGYLGQYADLHGAEDEPHNDYIRDLAKNGLASGEHGPIKAMGVPGNTLPLWDDIQFVTAQLAIVPQLDDVPVNTELIIGPNA